MSVWYCIPSARPVEEVEPVLVAWRERGYKVALWRDQNDIPHTDLNFYTNGLPYPGYAAAVNLLTRHILLTDPSCEWIVTGGDDTFPHPDKSAAQIAEECNEHFLDLWSDRLKQDPAPWSPLTSTRAETFGVMQPTGDRFAGGSIDRIAGSPWMGREWCLRANGGKGPFWPEFTHMFGDECLKRTAEKLGVYWARPDLVHLHRHFQRESDAIDARAVPKPIPPHLQQWNTRTHWDEMKAIFKRLEAEDFAPCLPV